MSNYTPAHVGDFISMPVPGSKKARRYRIIKILDQYEDWECDDFSYHCIECITHDGVHRTWKQRYDGGNLVPHREDKKVIAQSLETLLKLTRQFSDLDTCEYVKDENNDEWVILTGLPNKYDYRWTYRVNVNWDSGIALIQDVLRQIG